MAKTTPPTPAPKAPPAQPITPEEAAAPPAEPEAAAGGNGATPPGGAAVEAADEPAPAPKPVGDIFDNLEALRLKQNYNRIKVRKPFTLCPIRKPRPHEWFMVHPDPDYRFEATLFALKEDMSAEWYWPIGEDVLAELAGAHLHDVCIYTWINRKQDVCIWPVRLADAEGKMNSWHESMRDVFDNYATGSWCRIGAGDGGYAVEQAENQNLPTPDWPKHTMNEVLRVAFKGGRVIDNVNHPVILKLRGAI